MAITMFGQPPQMPDLQGAPIVSFGMFSDCQHSSLKNWVKVRGPRVRNRYPESSLALLTEAVEEWKSNNVSFLLNLGDLSELHEQTGYDRDHYLVEVLNCLERFPRPTYHVLGHHDLKQFTRKEFQNSKLHSAVNAPGAVPASHDKFYYQFSPTPGVRIVVLDLYEIALIGYDDNQDCPEYRRAVNLVKSKNPNPNKRDVDGLAWQDSKYTCINGAVTNIQLQWLVEVLDYSTKAGEICIVAGHNPLCATDKQRYSFMSWNNDDVLDVLHRYSCVVAYFGGHDADGGYVQDDHGIHHVTMPGLIETPSCSNAHASCHIYPDRLEIQGVGRCPSMTLFYHGKAKVSTVVRQPQKATALAPVAPASVVRPVLKKQVTFNCPQQRPEHANSHCECSVCPPQIIMPPPIQIQCPQPQPVEPCGPAPVQPNVQVQSKSQSITTYDPALGNIRKATPVTIAVPIEKLEAMGGVDKFMLAQAPANFHDFQSGGNKVWNLPHDPDVVENTPVFV